MYEKDEDAPAGADGQPWLVRKDWREMRVRSSPGLLGCWIMTALPVAFAAVIIFDIYSGDPPLVVKVLSWVVALPGVFALFLAFHATAGRIAIGALELELGELPIVPGREVVATVLTAKPVEVETASTSLSCKRARRKPGERRKIYSRSETVDPGKAVTEAGRTRVPLLIEVPADLPAINNPSGRAVRWRLGVRLKSSRGATYASFALPVFRVAESEILRRDG
ncbi:MAG: hypothetical protein ACYTKD_28845 [Planctomycetota bacterium]|jgi:hypothetical protein